MLRIPLGLLVVGGLFLGCEEPRPDPANYDQSCTANSDCVAVYNGCGCDCSPAGAINRRELERFERDVADAECSPLTPPEECLCSLANAVCENGKCAATCESPDGGS